MSEELKTVDGIFEYVSFNINYYRRVLDKIAEDNDMVEIASNLEKITEADTIINGLSFVEHIQRLEEETKLAELLGIIKDRCKSYLKSLLVLDGWNAKCTNGVVNLTAIYKSCAQAKVIKKLAEILYANEIELDIVPMLSVGF